MERQFYAIADIKGLKKDRDPSKCVCSAIIVADGNYKVLNTAHQTRLENVFKKLIVIECSSSLYLDNNLSVHTDGIGIEKLVYCVIETKQNRNLDFLVAVLPAFHNESSEFEVRPNNAQNPVARKVVLRRLDQSFGFPKAFNNRGNRFDHSYGSGKELKLNHVASVSGWFNLKVSTALGLKSLAKRQWNPA